MITVIARWDSTQMDSTLEHRMYRQLKGAYTQGDSANFRLIYVPTDPNAGGEHFDTMEEALLEAQGSLCFLEPSGTKTVEQMPVGDVTIVVGNTLEGNSQYAEADQMYRIDTPSSTDMYGVNAVAIALSHWWSNQ